MRVDHVEVLEALQPLPGGTIAGQRQVKRDGKMIIIASLAKTGFSDQWGGIRVRIVSPTAGELDSNTFLFGEHGTLPVDRDGDARLTVHTDIGTLEGGPLTKAVEQYVAAFR